MRNHRTSGGAFYRLPITHRTNPAIAGTVIHPHVCHVTTCNLKADIRGSDQSAVHVLPRTLSISSAWRGCGACPPFAYRKTRLILWQCVCARFGRFVSSICWFFVKFFWLFCQVFFNKTVYKITICDIISLQAISANVKAAKPLHIADSFFYCYLLFILSHFLQNKIKNSFPLMKIHSGQYEKPCWCCFLSFCKLFNFSTK